MTLITLYAACIHIPDYKFTTILCIHNICIGNKFKRQAQANQYVQRQEQKRKRERERERERERDHPTRKSVALCAASTSSVEFVNGSDHLNQMPNPTVPFCVGLMNKKVRRKQKKMSNQSCTKITEDTKTLAPKNASLKQLRLSLFVLANDG